MPEDFQSESPDSSADVPPPSAGRPLADPLVPPPTRRRVTRDGSYWTGRAADDASAVLPAPGSPRPLPVTRALEPLPKQEGEVEASSPKWGQIPVPAQE